MTTLPIACGIDGTVQPWDPQYQVLLVGNNSLSLLPELYAADTAPNLVLNGAFATDTVWTKGTDWTIASGVATRSGSVSSGTLSQALALVPGAQYSCTYTVTAYTAGSFTIRFIGGASVSGTSRSAVGTYTETLTANTGNVTLGILAVSGTAGSIDNVIVRRIR